MEGLLLANAAATLFMVGLAWFVDLVHYPLFAEVGSERFIRYHVLHSRRTLPVVLPAMTVELVTSVALAFDPPAGETALAIAGAVLAIGTWVLTGAAAVPAHRGLAGGLTATGLRRLRRVDQIRALTWTAHGIVVLALLAAAI